MYLSEECSTHGVTTIHADTVHGSKGDFYAPRAVMPFEKRKHYLVANLIVAVHSAKDCSASSMKLGVPKT